MTAHPSTSTSADLQGQPTSTAARPGLDRRRFLAGAALLGASALALPLTGCGNDASESASTSSASSSTDGEASSTPAASSASDAASASNTTELVTVGRPADSDNLDPVTCVGNTNIFIFNLIVEGLVKTSDDGMSIEPCLATDWDISDDGLTYTFHLLDNLKFSDGSAVTAQDWEWTFQRAIETEESNWHSAVENIDTVECPDDTTVVVTTKQSAASTLACLCIFELGVQSKAYYDKVGAEQYKSGIIGTGPFMLKEWKKGEYLSLEANPYYREEGLPLANQVDFKVVADDNARTIQLQGGDIDAATEMPFSTLKQLESDASCQPHADASTITRFLALNTENEFLSDQKVRQALTKATDPQEIVDMVLYGYGQTIGSIFSPTSEYCDATLKPNTPDVEGAKKLLEEAGHKDGFELKILIHGGNQQEQQVATILQSQWSKIGVSLVQDEAEATSYKERMYSMDFDLLIDMWSDDIHDPTPFMQFVFDFDSASGFDTNFRQPDDVAKLNEQADVESDVEKRKELYAQMQQAFAEQAIWIPLYSSPFQNAVREEVSGFVQTPLGNYRFERLTKTA